MDKNRNSARTTKPSSTKGKGNRTERPVLTRLQKNLLKSVDADALKAGLEEMRKAGFSARRGHELEDYYHWTEAQHNLVQINAAELALLDARREEEIFLAGDFNNNVFTFYNDVETSSVQEAIEYFSLRQRLYANSKDKPKFTLHLNSCGGSCVDGYALYDYLRVLSDRHGHHIVVCVRGAAMSMGGVLLQAGDTRVVNRNCILMIHAPWEEMGVVTGDNVGYKAKQLESMKKRVVKTLAQRSTLTPKQIEAKMKNKDWELTAEEAVANGFADVIE